MARGRTFNRSLLIAIIVLISGLTLHLHQRNQEDQNVKLTITEKLKALATGNRISERNCRGKKYLISRTLYTANGSSTFQIKRLAVCGDIHPHPGPVAKRNTKYPCKDCGKGVRSNQDAILCSQCNTWAHAKCIGFSKVQFKYYLENPTIDWRCWECDFPYWNMNEFIFMDNIDHIQPDNSSNLARNIVETNEYANKTKNSTITKKHSLHNNTDNPDTQYCSNSDLMTHRNKNASDILLSHLNINSIQNKFEELKLLNNKLKSQIIVITETKIDESYPNAQFQLNGYEMYRKDRKKGGGGIITFVSTYIPSKKIKLSSTYKTMEVLALEVKINNPDVLFICIYRPPKAVGDNYYTKLEDELNGLTMWATMQKQCVILIGDLNLNRLNLNQRECKILTDL